MNWCQRILFLKDLENAVAIDGKKEADIDALIDFFKMLITDMLNLKLGLLEKGFAGKLNLILHHDYKAELVNANGDVFGIRIDSANMKFIISSRIGEDQFGGEDIFRKEVDERLYQHAKSILINQD